MLRLSRRRQDLATYAKVYGSTMAALVAIGAITHRYPVAVTRGALIMNVESQTPFGVLVAFMLKTMSLRWSRTYWSWAASTSLG